MIKSTICLLNSRKGNFYSIYDKILFSFCIINICPKGLFTLYMVKGTLYSLYGEKVVFTSYMVQSTFYFLYGKKVVFTSYMVKRTFTLYMVKSASKTVNCIFTPKTVKSTLYPI